MYLHENESFRDVILEVSNRSGISEDIIEKDYYITLILKELRDKESGVVFKGGTSLSKAFHAIDRFSEDVDITFTEYLDAQKRKRLKYSIIKPISRELGLTISNWKKTASYMDYNKYELSYKSISEMDNPIPPMVVLETALMSYSFPVEDKEITSIIYDYLKETDMSVLEKYDLVPFEMKVQSLVRTLVDKMFAVCDYYILGRARRNSRHLYDVYKLYPLVNENEIEDLIKEVRIHRAKMDDRIAPSAKEDVDIPSVVNALLEEDFYKTDYEERTVGLINDDISYDEVK